MGLIARASLFVVAATLPLQGIGTRVASATDFVVPHTVKLVPPLDPPLVGVRFAQAKGTAEVAKDPETDRATDDENPFAIRRPQVPLLQSSNEAETGGAIDDEEEPSLFTEWWFWAAAAVVVGGTIALGVLASKPGETKARPCGMGFVACFGDGL